MHRNVIDNIIEAVGNEIAIFNEIGTGKSFMGEDIYFFALVGKADIPVYCHTGSLGIN
jgi:hypothetical protein